DGHVLALDLALTVVRGLAGNHDVMDVAFAQASTRDAYKAGAFLELANVCTTDITHRSTKTADHLVDDRSNRALIGRLALDTFRHQFLGRHFLLEVTVRRAG